MDFTWVDWLLIAFCSSFGVLALFYAILLARS